MAQDTAAAAVRVLQPVCLTVERCCVACLKLLLRIIGAPTAPGLSPSSCCRDTQQYYQRFVRESFVNHEDEGPERLDQIVSRAREDAQWVLQKVGLPCTAGTRPVLLVWPLLAVHTTVPRV